jgi:hypothetical protein
VNCPNRTPCLRSKPPRVLVQRLDVIGDLGARHDAVALDQPERHAARQPGDRLVAAMARSGSNCAAILRSTKCCNRRCTFSDHLGARIVLDEGLGVGFIASGPATQPPDRLFAPQQPALLGHLEGGVGRVVEPVGAQVELGPQRRHRRLPQRLGLIGARRFVLAEPEPVDPAQT